MLYLSSVTHRSAKLGNRNAMVNSSSANSDRETPDLSETQAELLQSVLSEESYPWVPADVAAGYEESLAAAGQALEISDEEAAAGWQRLSGQLDQAWVGTDADVLTLLKQKFSPRLPESVLVAIGDRARQMALSTPKNAQPMVTRMIDCVKETVSAIGEADLQVMARPMAFAMRSSGAEELVDATVNSVRQANWETLSPLEQARLSLAAARYAIAKVEEGRDS